MKKKNQTKHLDTIINRKNESDAIHSENIKVWKKVGIAAGILVLIVIVSCVINIYEAVSKKNIYAGYVVLALLILLIIIFVIIPIIKVMNAPNFVIDAAKPTNEINQKNYLVMRAAAKNLIKSENQIPFEEKENLKSKLGNRIELRDELVVIYQKYITKEINEIIWATSTKVALVTGFSKNSSFDTLTTIIYNIRMVMQIVVKCGYRPSYTKLAKLITHVFKNALLAYTIQSINFGDLIVGFVGKFFSNVPAVGSVIDGASNGFLSARVGVLTKKYLFKEFDYSSKEITKEEQNKQLETCVEEAKEIINNEGKI